MHRSIVFALALAASAMSASVAVIASMSGVGPFLAVGLGVVAVVASIVASEVLEILKEKAESNNE